MISVEKAGRLIRKNLPSLGIEVRRLDDCLGGVLAADIFAPISLPLFNNAAMDPAAVDKFLQTISQPGNQPAFIHCARGNRAAGMWFVKRVLVDKWDIERAGAEAASLGLSNPALKTFMLNYIESHKK